VGIVKLLRRYDKLWMNRRVRSVNLQLDRALKRCNMSHVYVTDTNIIVRDNYRTYGLHLNSRSKMRLTHLTAESICDGHMPSRNSSIPVTMHATASLSLG
jgi:hypothetical protein